MQHFIKDKIETTHRKKKVWIKEPQGHKTFTLNVILSSSKSLGVLSTSRSHTPFPTPFILACKLISMNALDEFPIIHRAPARGVRYPEKGSHLGHICLRMHEFCDPIDIQTVRR